MAKTITQRTKAKAKERSKDTQLARIKERKELVTLMIESYLTHDPSNVAYIQIMRSNSNKSFRTSISYQHNLPLGKSCYLASCSHAPI
jgi:hypothetical protein